MDSSYKKITGYDWDRKRLKNRWKNFKLHNKETITKGEMPISNEQDKRLSEIPDNPNENIEEDSNNCEVFFQENRDHAPEIQVVVFKLELFSAAKKVFSSLNYKKRAS